MNIEAASTPATAVPRSLIFGAESTLEVRERSNPVTVDCCLESCATYATLLSSSCRNQLINGSNR